MRNAIAALIAAGAVSFAGAGVANATPTPALPTGPAVTSTTTIAAGDDNGDNGDHGDNGLWGLAGLLGLLGLLGLKRRNDVDRRVGTGTATGTTGPRG